MNEAARTQFYREALAVGIKHNLLAPSDAAIFSAAIASNNAGESEGWALGVIYDLGYRCRSFRPDSLTRLETLGRAAGCIE